MSDIYDDNGFLNDYGIKTTQKFRNEVEALLKDGSNIQEIRLISATLKHIIGSLEAEARSSKG